MATHVFLFFLAIQMATGSENYRSDGFLDKLSNGMKIANDLLGPESLALKVADFVVKAFQTGNRPPPAYRRPTLNNINEDSYEDVQENKPNYYVNEAPNPVNPLRYLVKLMGLQTNQISAVAVNALVFVAQMISTFFTGPKRSHGQYRSEDPTNWILNKNSGRLQELINTAKNESILYDIDELIKQQGSDEETSCIRLLVCKITPYVHKMQNAVFGENNSSNADNGNLRDLRGSAVMYRHLPTADEVKATSDICERRHKDCDLNE
ncbi:uncharacterized protein LOC113512739 [Galleria mellonella]|uniref:Uncharacterized protein LOC113512739 n=1 Tax=Galleria mellonella TaxID=7137 RepID=A0A6J1WMP6_GALME|nr:uncharacterized protein LOC113512739 [Galleria mellonella]